MVLVEGLGWGFNWLFWKISFVGGQLPAWGNSTILSLKWRRPKWIVFSCLHTESDVSFASTSRSCAVCVSVTQMMLLQHRIKSSVSFYAESRLRERAESNQDFIKATR